MECEASPEALNRAANLASRYDTTQPLHRPSSPALPARSSSSSGAPLPPVPATPAAAAPRELTVVHVDGGAGLEPAIDWFTEALAARSDGALTVSFEFQCCGGESDVEQQLIDRVADGEADLGWVGVRAMHDAGTSALDPFIAPLLIPGYDAEQAILQSDDASDVLSALDEVGVQGLGLLPGGLRYPVSTGAPLDDPASWPGLRFYSFASSVGFDALRALGVEPLSMSFDERDAGLDAGTVDALDNSLVYQAEHTDVLPFALVNVPLSARISALIASPDLALSDQEREWIDEAVADTVARTSEFIAIDEAAVASGCTNAGQYAAATDAELAAFAAAVAPVDAAIAADAVNGPVLDRLRALAAAHPAEPAPTCETAAAGSSGSDAAGALDGSFTTILWDEAAQRAHGMPDDKIVPGATGYGAFVFTFDDGDFTTELADGGLCSGTYDVDAGSVTLNLAAGPCGAGRFFTADFTVSDGALTFTDVDATHPPEDTILFGSEPLTQVK